LLLRRQVAVQRQHGQGTLLRYWVEVACRLANLVQARQEDEQVPVGPGRAAVPLRELPPSGQDRRSDRGS